SVGDDELRDGASAAGGIRPKDVVPVGRDPQGDLVVGLIIEGDRQHGASQVDVNRQHLLGFELLELAAKAAGIAVECLDANRVAQAKQAPLAQRPLHAATTKELGET
ncbi:MAG: hypothetical protein EBU59_11205, partial [Planctomycetia bacterium]|nr:hypothetical protein [Planctomycetia bacterium]